MKQEFGKKVLEIILTLTAAALYLDGLYFLALKQNLWLGMSLLCLSFIAFYSIAKDEIKMLFKKSAK